MTVRHGTWVSQATAGVGVTSPLEARLALAAQLVKDASGKARQGALYDGITNFVTGGATMVYNVARIAIAQVRSASDGACIFVNDGAITVSVNDQGGSLTAPGSNSRIDIIYAWQRDFALDGANSDALIAVRSGAAAVSPVAPVLPVGAVEIARAVVGAGITATTSAAITNTIPFTASAGATVMARNLNEIAAPVTWNDGVEVLLIDSGMSILRAGGGWVPSRPNKTGIYRPMNPTDTFTNVGAFVPFANNGSALTRPFTKFGENTRLHITMEATSQFMAGVSQRALLGLKLGSRATDEVTRRYFAEGSGRQSWGGEAFISGVPAGTFNAVPQFMMSPASQMTFFVNDDYLSWSIEEVS